MGHRIVVIGASAGGVAALSHVLARLAPALDAAIFIVMHTGASPSRVPKILGRTTRLAINHARDADPIVPGKVYVAPPDRHMLLEPGRIRLVHGPKENHTRPAIDPLFRSAAIAYGPRVIGVILTGYLDDGTAGLLAIKDRGGIAIVQDPADAEAPSMPRSAAAHVAVDHCRPLDDFGLLLSGLAADDAMLSASETSDVRRESWTRLIELEHRIAEAGVALTDRDWWNELTIPSALTCPECQGVLGEVRDHRVLRFRCQIGHAYSGQTLLSLLAATSEAALDASLRTLVQEADVARRLSAQPGEAKSDPLLVELARDSATRALELRTMLRSMSEQIEV